MEYLELFVWHDMPGQVPKRQHRKQTSRADLRGDFGLFKEVESHSTRTTIASPAAELSWYSAADLPVGPQGGCLAGKQGLRSPAARGATNSASLSLNGLEKSGHTSGEGPDGKEIEMEGVVGRVLSSKVRSENILVYVCHSLTHMASSGLLRLSDLRSLGT